MFKAAVVRGMVRLFAILVLLVGAMVWGAPVFAACPTCEPGDGDGGGSSNPGDLYPESFYKERLKVGGTLQPLSDTPFGEKIDLYTGGISFLQTDAGLKGIGPAMAITRSFVPGRFTNRWPWGSSANLQARTKDFADWELELPRITTTVPAETTADPGVWGPNARCSQMAAQPNPAYTQTWRGGGPPSFSYEWWWSGYDLVIPGSGVQQILKRASVNPLTPTNLGTGLPINFPLVTKQHWMIGCLPGTSNGQPGEGFLVVDTNGTKYWLNHLIFKGEQTITYFRQLNTPSTTAYVWALNRKQAIMLPSRAEDRFGNWVTYSYNGSSLTGMSSSDGRSLSIEWQNTFISKVTAQPSSGTPRVWTYQYVNTTQDSQHAARLISVTQPDARQWKFNLDTIASESPQETLDLPVRVCTDPVGNLIGAGAYNNTGPATITHPSGVVGTYAVSSRIHGKSYVPKRCVGAGATGIMPKWPLSPHLVYSPTLLSRTLSGPAMPTQTWTYSYSEPNGSFASDCTVTSCPTTVATKVTEPDSSSTTYTFSNRWDVTEGQLVSSVVEAANGVVKRDTDQFYNSPTAGPYSSRLGTLFTTVLNTDLLTQLAPMNLRTLVQDGDTYTWQALAFDRYGNAVQTKRFNGIASQMAIQEQVMLANDDAYNQAKWVLGQVKQEINQTLGQTVSSTVYNSSGLPQDRYSFGMKVMSYAWDAQGRLASFQDGLNRTTTLGNYRFDIPRLVTFADNSTKTAVVSDFGEVASLTDQNGATTSYQYNTMGLLLRTDYPTGDTVAWAPTITTYDVLSVSELGVPAGSWRARTNTGRFQISTYYDARWRPVLVEERDTTTAETIYRRTGYDHESNHIFESYPSSTYIASAGTNSSYDTLGRLTQKQTTTGITLESVTYLSGARKQTIDADGKATTIGYQVFDSPVYNKPIKIQAEENQTTDIVRDLYGKTISVTQSGTWSGGSISQTRSFTYDVYQRPCRRVDPESGATRWGYNAANEIGWEAKGQPSTVSCTDPKPANATNFTYDLLGRKTVEDYADDADNVLYSYDLAGNLRAVNNGTAKWTYAYNKRNLPETEQVVIDGKTLLLNPTYDALAHVQSLTTPARTITYAPDAWGRPTQLGSYASGIQYHPNGMVSGYSGGTANVITYSQTLDSLQRPLRQLSKAGTTTIQDFQYSYSNAGDLLSLADAGEADSLTLGYDNLHRIKVATGLWGAYGYVYDPLNNVRSRTGPNALSYSYSASNLLSGISGSQSRVYSYNAKGEITGDGSKSFTLNSVGQIQAIGGIASYGYDGNGKRIKTVKGGITEYTLYDQSGKLVYTEQATTKADYLSLGGQIVAELKLTGTTLITNYLYPDLLGSPRKASDGAGIIVWEEHYDPYGKKINEVANKIGYTGHAHDLESGYTYMQARFYDAAVGRFLSTDPIPFKEESAFTFNRYSYSNNSPYKYKDPTGTEASFVYVIYQAEDELEKKLRRLSDSERSAMSFGLSAGLPEEKNSITDGGRVDKPTPDPVTRPYLSGVPDMGQVLIDFHVKALSIAASVASGNWLGQALSGLSKVELARSTLMAGSLAVPEAGVAGRIGLTSVDDVIRAVENFETIGNGVRLESAAGTINPTIIPFP